MKKLIGLLLVLMLSCHCICAEEKKEDFPELGKTYSAVYDIPVGDNLPVYFIPPLVVFKEHLRGSWYQAEVFSEGDSFPQPIMLNLDHVILLKEFSPQK